MKRKSLLNNDERAAWAKLLTRAFMKSKRGKELDKKETEAIKWWNDYNVLQLRKRRILEEG